MSMTVPTSPCTRNRTKYRPLHIIHCCVLLCSMRWYRYPMIHLVKMSHRPHTDSEFPNRKHCWECVRLRKFVTWGTVTCKRDPCLTIVLVSMGHILKPWLGFCACRSLIRRETERRHSKRNCIFSDDFWRLPLLLYLPSVARNAYQLL